MTKFRGLILVLVILLVLGGFVSIKFYGYVFAKTIRGEIVRVERVIDPSSVVIMGGAPPNSQMYSFAIAIKDEKGEYHTASTEDRQWAVVEKGQCAEARFFPYPPWNLAKANTYYGARLERLFECGGNEGGDAKKP